MRKTKLTAKTIMAVVTTMVVLVLFQGVAFAQLTTKLSATQISIESFYHGSELKVSGKTDAGMDLVIKVASPDNTDSLKTKAKSGPFWMNKGEIKFKNAPDVCFVFSSKNLKDILSAEEMDKYVIGYPALRKHIKIEIGSEVISNADWFNEFVKFKEAAGLYGVYTKGITVTRSSNQASYNAKIDWPFQIAPGNYTVFVYEVRNSKVVDKAQENLVVEKSGFVKTLADMAQKNGAMYGALAIVVALIAGFGIGLIFKTK